MKTHWNIVNDGRRNMEKALGNRRQLRKREPRRFVEKKPWGRQLDVDGILYMWRIGNDGVVIRTHSCYYSV
jgi:hypothetical protein